MRRIVFYCTILAICATITGATFLLSALYYALCT